MAHNFTDKQRTADIELKTERDVDFSGLLLSPLVSRGLKNAGFVRPSPIQLEAIPIGRCGADLIVQAKSGTGKTCVFTVVALESIKADNKNVQVLVLAPTREIVVQIHEVVSSLASAMPHFKSDYFIGGTPFAEDKIKMKNCQMALGTPGRIQQLIQENVLKTDAIRLFVLDEADKLLEENFQTSINWIYHKLPSSKQVLALSATYPETLAQLLTKYMQTPTFVRISEKNPALIGVKQFYKITEFHPLQGKAFENKVAHVLNVLSMLPFGQCIIFSNYQMRAEALCDRLNARGWPAVYISSKKEQVDRLRAIASLREFKCRVLISTDLTARGIDIENVNLVLNLDVPWDLETYLHRIGRAGRFGSHGIAITFASDGEEEKLLMSMKTDGKLTAFQLPDKLGPDLWETMLLTDSVKKDSNEDIGTAAVTKGTPSVEGVSQKIHDARLATTGSNQDSHSEGSFLPRNPWRSEVSKIDSDGDLERMSIIRDPNRVVHRVQSNKEDAAPMSKINLNLEPEMMDILKKLNLKPPSFHGGQAETTASPEKCKSDSVRPVAENTNAKVGHLNAERKKVAIRYDSSVKDDEKNLKDFIDTSGLTCEVCATREEETTSSKIQSKRDFDLNEEDVRNILYRSHQKLIDQVRHEQLLDNQNYESNCLLEMLSQMVDIPSRKPAESQIVSANDTRVKIQRLPTNSPTIERAKDKVGTISVAQRDYSVKNDKKTVTTQSLEDETLFGHPRGPPSRTCHPSGSTSHQHHSLDLQRWLHGLHSAKYLIKEESSEKEETVRDSRESSYPTLL